MYEEKRAGTLTKKELTAEVRKLRAKREKIFKEEEEETYESDLSNRISNDDTKEEDYRPPTPQTTMTAKRKNLFPTKSKYQYLEKEKGTQQQYPDSSITQRNWNYTQNDINTY